jgi:hypothetical protein
MSEANELLRDEDRGHCLGAAELVPVYALAS